MQVVYLKTSRFKLLKNIALTEICEKRDFVAFLCTLLNKISLTISPNHLQKQMKRCGTETSEIAQLFLLLFHQNETNFLEVHSKQLTRKI